MIKLEYDRNRRPPAPVVDLIISSEDNPILQIRCNGMIDTGVEITCIPREIINKLGLSPVGTVVIHPGIEDIIKVHTQVYAYRANISFTNFNFNNVTVISNDRDCAFLGRDILNKLVILLDGKNLILEIKDEETIRQLE